MHVILTSGFKGIEKENALFSMGNYLISKGKKVVVLITEHLDDNDKSGVTADTGLVIREKVSSCVPCSFLFDLIAEIEDIYKGGNTEILIIELPFNSMPSEIKEALGNIEDMELSFAPTLHVFDVMNLGTEINMIPKVVISQIAASDTVLLNSKNVVPEKMDSLKKAIEKINTRSNIIEYTTNTQRGEIDHLDDILLVP